MTGPGAIPDVWRAITDASPDPVVILDAEHRCVAVSSAVVDELGTTTGDVVGQPFDALVVDADGSSVLERLDRVDRDHPAEFGIVLGAPEGAHIRARTAVRCVVVDDQPHHVLTLRRVGTDGVAETELRRRVELEQLLERVQLRFINAVPAEIGDVITWALRDVASFLGADRGYVLTFDHDARTETMIHEWAAPGVEPELGTYADVSFALAPAAASRNTADWISAVPDVSKLDGEWALDRKFFEEAGLRSILELPIVIDGDPVGALGFDWLVDLADWTEDDLTVLRMLAPAFAQLLGRDAAEREMARRASHDELTGLPNRVGLLAELRSAELAAVVVIDVDQFKVVNDSLGNSAGDQLLRLVAARLRRVVRPGDVVAKLGGDEFAVALRDVPDEWTLSEATKRIRTELSQPYRFLGRDHLLTVSCGVAIRTDDPGSDAVGGEELLRRAGAAMYRAKELGRDCEATYDTDLEERIAVRLELDQRLRVALERHEFEVHYQPEVDIATGQVLGAEALLRWRRDGRLCDAGSFIEVVEETGLIVEVGRWVLEEACAAASRWSRTTGNEDFVIRVNLSPRQFDDPDLVDLVRLTLDRHRLAPHLLCLEITETALARNPDAALAVVRRLDALGVTLALDDFGTGYSSLSYLKSFPVDVVKIDRSFVDGLPADEADGVIVSTIIGLARSLGMAVTAEGIETAAQAVALLGLGCTRGQGWHYSKAVPRDELEAMLLAVPAA